MKLYGIPNCDTVKKARSWLNEHGLTHEFHDYKKQGVSDAMLRQWVAQVGWEKLLNKQGTTWRKLSPEQQAAVTDADSAIAALLAQPSMIKRPLIETEGVVQTLGFDAERYQALFLRD